MQFDGAPLQFFMLPTISIDSVIETFRAHVTGTMHEDELRTVYDFAAKAHEGQVRKSGEPYIQHSLYAALTLAKLGVDEATLKAALLHDVPEDTKFTIQDVKEKFGHEVAYLVNGVTKLSKVQYKNHMEEHQVESLRKMLLVMAKDIRVVLIKLSDRLHNMETLTAVRPEKRLRIAKETIEIFAPLADRLGIWELKWRLEDLCFRYIYPVQYAQLKEQIQEGSEDRETYIKQVSAELDKELKKAGITASISGRTKHLYSVYKKMSSKRKQLTDIYDLFALRIVVEDVKDCYAVLGIIHDVWRPKPGRFKDYIAVPKANGYQSLHTTVFCTDGKLTEFQIRTSAMHDEAEYGVAAHWHYDSTKTSDEYLKGRLSRAPTDQLSWIRNLMELNESMSDSKEFLEGMKIDLFRDRIFVYTPLGDVKDLPAGSTCVDFAYTVHTDLGHSCIGAKVNGTIVQLDTQLKTGDVVTILTSKIPQGPKRDWLKFAVTNHARNKIRAWFKSEDAKINIGYGSRLLEEELIRMGKGKVKDLSKQRIQQVLDKLEYQSFNDIFVALGEGTLRTGRVIQALFATSELLAQGPARSRKAVRPRGAAARPRDEQVVLIEGERNMPVRFGKCCTPTQKSRIIGFITRGRGITIHDEQCKSLKNLDPERMIHASWAGAEVSHDAYRVDIIVEGDDRVGLLNDILSVLSGLAINILALHARPKSLRSTQFIYDEFTLEIHTFDQLEKVFSMLQKVSGVTKVYRKK